MDEQSSWVNSVPLLSVRWRTERNRKRVEARRMAGPRGPVDRRVVAAEWNESSEG